MYWITFSWLFTSLQKAIYVKNPVLFKYTKLESLNLDSCRIGDEGLQNLTGLLYLKNLELSDTPVGSTGLKHISGLTRLENLNLWFTVVSDGSLRKLSGLTSLKSLNLDSCQITDAGLAGLTGLTGLTHLDLFGARITDYGTNWLRCVLITTYPMHFNSVAYALLITLCRGTLDEIEFMRKQQLIDAAKASGLSQVMRGCLMEGPRLVEREDGIDAMKRF